MTRTPHTHALLLVSTLALLLVSNRVARPATPADDTVRWDWYFRESLAAIRDWETILQRLEKESPPQQTAPVLPVPTDGGWVVWPNPIPRRLLPPKDLDRRLRVRLAGQRVEVQRPGGQGKVAGEAVAAGEEVLGYLHPGRGGKDQWYHRYQRRFDRLLRFRAKPAPFSVRLDAPLDLGRGRNEVPITLHNATDAPLKLTARLVVHRPARTRRGEARTLVLPPREDRALRFPLVLADPGGSLAMVELEAAGESFRIPLLTHVEQVASVLKSVEQILQDTPDPEASQRLHTLRQRAELAGGETQGDWHALFEEASGLRDRLLLTRISFDTLLFVKRKPYFSEQPFMDAHHLFNRPGGGIYRLSPVCPQGVVTPVVDSLGEGVYRDPCLHWNAEKMLFAFGNGSDKWDGSQSYHVYEVRVDGSGLRRLTSGPRNDCEPFYLPGGGIGFTSDRSGHFVMCGGDRHAPTLYEAEADGSGVRQVSFNMFNDFNPTVLADGRILYSRWEYNERSVTSLHDPFTMNPDGTMVAPYYGNATFRPNVVMFPRPVPHSHKIMALFTAHHGQTHGTVGLVDIRRGRDGPKPLEILTPHVPLMGEHAEDSRWGWFSDPRPLSESTFLCSYTPTVLPWLETSWALYLGDRHGNLALVYRDANISSAEPLPLVRRERPHVRASALPETGQHGGRATLTVVDVYTGLEGVSRPAAKYLRILEDVPRKDVPRGGVVLTSGTSIYTIKRILGTVPIEEDGSAQFTVPADRNVYFQVLDCRRREIQRMRSVVCLKAGEYRTCIGCHEHRNTAPPNHRPQAIGRPPSSPRPPPWGTRIISFLRDVQPVLNARCIGCHTYQRSSAGVILTDDLTDQFTIGYEELLPYLRVANAMRWDQPEDVLPRPPYSYGSKVSPLAVLLDSGHHGLALSDDERMRLFNWIDANGVYYDRYESDAYGPKRHLFSDDVRQPVVEVYQRRCEVCHGSGDGKADTWWLSLNRRDLRQSRVLAAPLARAAGGWQRCGDAVFADSHDADYQKLLAALDTLRQRLVERPREDLLSLAGSEAEHQQVELPPPPPPAKAESLPPGNWVYLSDRRWQSATSGWTPNGDGLPRRDHDVRGQLLRLGRKRYRKGIGTHAPSQVVYRLEGKYDRLSAIAGGAERGGTVVFQVFGDDRLLFDSGPMRGLEGTRTVDLPIAGVDQLRLVVTDAGDNYYCDMANWADARLRRAKQPASSPQP